MAKREQCIELIDKIESHDWTNYKCCGFDRTETAILLQLLQKWKRESDRHKKDYSENSDYYKKINSDRYYKNKTKISEGRKTKYRQEKPYDLAKLEVFKK